MDDGSVSQSDGSQDDICREDEDVVDDIDFKRRESKLKVNDVCAVVPNNLLMPLQESQNRKKEHCAQGKRRQREKDNHITLDGKCIILSCL